MSILCSHLLRLDGPGLFPPLQPAVSFQEGVILPLQLEQDSDLLLDRKAGLPPVPLGLRTKDRCDPVLCRSHSITHHCSRAPESRIDSEGHRGCHDRCPPFRGVGRHAPVASHHRSETLSRSGARVASPAPQRLRNRVCELRSRVASPAPQRLRNRVCELR